MSVQEISRTFTSLMQQREVQRWRYIAGHTLDATIKMTGLELRLKSVQSRLDLSETFQLVAGSKPPEQDRRLRNVFSQYAAKSYTDIGRRLNKARLAIKGWKEAREENNAQKALKPLGKLIKQARREAKTVQYNEGHKTIYDAVLHRQTPGLTTKRFEALSRDIIDFHEKLSSAQRIEVASRNLPDDAWHMDLDKQAILFERVLTAMGYDFTRGEIAETDHPATLGQHDDVRVGMRYNPDDFMETLLTAIHEGGHALYRQNLPADQKDDLSGAISGVAMDEAMALLMENHIGRSFSGAVWLHKLVSEVAPEKAALLRPSDFHQKMTETSNVPVRTSADEIRYPLDVILRFRMEKAMFDDELPAEDLPTLWADTFKELTGFDTNSDNEGILQDIHWFADEFGWFPNYMLGQIMAAQIFETALSADPDIPKQIRHGDFSGIRSWLKDNIYSQGAKYDPFELVENVTGQAAGTQAWQSHILERYYSSPFHPGHRPGQTGQRTNRFF